MMINAAYVRKNGPLRAVKRRIGEPVVEVHQVPPLLELAVDFNDLPRGGQLVHRMDSPYRRYEGIASRTKVLATTDEGADSETVICRIASVEGRMIYLIPDWRTIK